MTQPPNPVPPRGNRPQLFSAPPAKAKPGVRAKGHADFGPSILATIDGGQARFATARDRLPVKRVLLMSAIALLLVAGYVFVKFNVSHAAAAPQAVAARTPVVMPVAAKAVEASASVVPVVEQGSATIETVASVAVPASATAANPPINVVASVNTIQAALDRPEPLPVKKEKAPAKDPGATRVATAAAPPVSKPTARGLSAPDNDAELLAAMLPHLKRNPVTPTSPAYEKRCGQLSGDAAVDCRAKFCNGRQGADAACPAAALAQP